MFNPSMGIRFRDRTFALRANCPVSESYVYLVSMLNVQSQVSNFMFSYIDGGTQFRGRGILPSQAREGTPLPLNRTATTILSACHMFNLSLIGPVTLEFDTEVEQFAPMGKLSHPCDFPLLSESDHSHDFLLN